MSRYKLLLLTVFPLSSLLIGCNPNITREESFFAFDTFFKISVDSANEKAAEEIKEICLSFEKEADPNNAYENINNIYTLNHTSEVIKVSENLFDCLSEAYYYEELTNGYFSYKLGQLTSLYKKSYEEGKLPDDSLVNQYTANLATSELIFDNKVSYKVHRKGDALIDLGAIAKGYCLKLVKDYLDTNKITTYLINAGSSSILMGQKNNGASYNVSLKYDNGRVMELKNTSFGCAAIFEQYIEIDGKKYSHIINPKTGKPELTYDAVYVASKDPIEADALATAFTIPSYTYWNDIIPASDIDYACFIKDNSTVYEYKRNS